MNFLFNDWTSMFRILLVGTLAYLSLIIILRIFGKRALSKMNAYDFMVTVALGAILATTVVSKDVALVDGIFAIVLLIFLQYILTRLIRVSKSLNHLIKSSPVVLFYKNEFDYDLMKKERVLEEEIYQAIRSKGYASLNNVLAVVLETTGDISVLPKNEDNSNNSTLKDLSLEQFVNHSVEKQRVNVSVINDSAYVLSENSSNSIL